MKEWSRRRLLGCGLGALGLAACGGGVPTPTIPSKAALAPQPTASQQPATLIPAAPSPTLVPTVAPPPPTKPAAAAATSPSIGAWTTRAPVPTPRSEVAAALVGGKIYVLAGIVAAGAATNEEYDPAADRWQRRRDVPLPRGSNGRDHPAAAEVGGKLYLVGGFGADGRPLDSLLEYDPISDSWRELIPMPTARGALGAAAIDGKLYAVGGVTTRGDTGAIELFDPSAGRWQPLRPMATPRDHLGVAALGGKLYVAGGRLGNMARNVDVLEEYDPVRDAWTTRRPMPTARSGVAAAAAGGKLYVFGGERPDRTFPENEEYDPATDTWRAQPPLPTPRHGLAAVTVGDAIHTLAGGPTPGGSRSGANEVFRP